MALLTVYAYLRKRRQGRRLMRRWQREEEGEDALAFLTVRDLEDQEGPYPWEEDEGEL